MQVVSIVPGSVATTLRVVLPDSTTPEEFEGLMVGLSKLFGMWLLLLLRKPCVQFCFLAAAQHGCMLVELPRHTMRWGLTC